MVKKLIITGAVIAGLCLGAYFVAGYYLGNVPVVSQLLGTNKTRDLGVSVSVESAYAGLEKLNSVSVIQDTENVKDAVSMSIPVSTSLTSEQVSSLMALSSMAGLPVKVTQVKLGDNGYVQASGILYTEDMQKTFQSVGIFDSLPIDIMGYAQSGKSFNFYVEGSFSIVNNEVAGHLDSAKIGNIELPAEVINHSGDSIRSAVSRLLREKGYDIRKVLISGGKVDLDMDRPAGGVENWLNF